MNTVLTEKQIQIGAKYLVAVDTGRLSRKIPPPTKPEIMALIEKMDRDYAMKDAEVFAMRNIELDYFMKELRNGDPYFVTAIKENLPWLFKGAI